MKKVKIALTKGRLEEKAIEIFKDIGVNVDELLNKGRKLIFHSENKEYNIEFFLVKAPDVTTYVDYGAADIGIVGKDTLMEKEKDFYEVMDLKIGKCKFAVATLPEIDIYKGYNIKKIATKYPKVARKYFRNKGIDVELIKIEGSVELAPIVGLADAIVDIVETGSTLKENGLVVVEDICNISARMIVNKTSMKTKQNEISKIIENVNRVVNN
ncbi:MULTISPECIES: ATP phosphoribosyltransferase [Clostridium]|uniref:ATP phosphoribosyltransferase n=1 Tax=Clostridium novyi (strain NT) TaxID=386415 RepID=HIS1_CLONN|nr:MULTISPECIES: ATP phosphoribosyltransferase [Clostridium]A0PXP3.1 RecName: Full=ATP phosphoribosyltransferase; Short=ATP-PRT; Short=ATP-PRTase [Clostridium novyi NT]ABK61899.1 ATP phosphoribosyltransferase [Clostridium novyi NT]KEH84915.1 ATP phosphoribosyltransferase [Clostridium novyi A str. NCTC 538]KEH85123.1 ATP phosphoribosyltransferase [Clostridium novyi A str. 4540]KEH91388.1 ATP phosphoribosyltransferase [Clostridium novyi A str. GD211209]KEH91510.1 ATP phosphoribosyltransferase [